MSFFKVQSFTGTNFFCKNAFNYYIKIKNLIKWKNHETFHTTISKEKIPHFLVITSSKPLLKNYLRDTVKLPHLEHLT